MTPYFKRNIDSDLLNWKQEVNRKPLLVRGARQVGKSRSIKQFGATFENLVVIDFEQRPEIHSLFEGNLDPHLIVNNISAITGLKIENGKTLLYFDEIQACPKAIISLRYFYEQLPDLHVIASGSLLEFALEEVHTFGVGRVQSLYMYPFCFQEFLMANDQYPLIDMIAAANIEKPLHEAVHKKALEYLKLFFIVGGMPAVVSEFILTKNLLNVQKAQSIIIESIQADFVKYKKRIVPSRLIEVLRSVIEQMGSKFTYTYAQATLNNLQIKECLSLLQKAGLIYECVHSQCNGIPLGAQLNHKFTKYFFFDTGLAINLLGLQIGDYILNEQFHLINKGSIAEQHVSLELIKNSRNFQKAELFYWQKLQKNSQAEVDFVIQKSIELIPVEVKSGSRGAMQSLHQFLLEKKLDLGYRTSMENFGMVSKIKIFPLYAIDKMLEN